MSRKKLQNGWYLIQITREGKERVLFTAHTREEVLARAKELREKRRYPNAELEIRKPVVLSEDDFEVLP